MTNQSQLAVASIIQRCAERHAEVLGVRYEVLWPDGTTVHLHPVRQHGADSTFLRALHSRGTWWLFDLTQVLTREQCDEIKRAPERDQVGLVMYALRRCYHNAPELLDKIARVGANNWAGDARGAGVRPTRTGRTVEKAEA